jgi:hypothetical protein
VRALGRLTTELAKAYEESQKTAAAGQHPAQPAPSDTGGAAAVCVTNGTAFNLRFNYHWGSNDWSDQTIEANRSMVYWFPMRDGEKTAPRFYIEYDDSFAPGYTTQSYELERYALSLPATCDSAKQYAFSSRGQQIILQSVN